MPIRKKADVVPVEEVTPDMFDADDEVELVIVEDEDGFADLPPTNHNNPPEELPPEPVQNKPPKKPTAKKVDPEEDAKNKLADFTKRVLNIRDEKKALAEDEKAVFTEAKAAGYDVKALKAAIAALAKDKEERTEFEDLRDFYIEILEARV